jgi:hypothetical protein
MLKRLFGKQAPPNEPQDEATVKFYELVGLYTMSFNPGGAKPEWFQDRLEELERALGQEAAKAAYEYASEHESFYHRLTY